MTKGRLHGTYVGVWIGLLESWCLVVLSCCKPDSQQMLHKR